MHVQVPLRVRLAVGGRLVQPGRVRERHAEEVVVAPREPPQHVGQPVALGAVELRQARHRPPAHDERLEGPHRPERHERDEGVVGDDDPLPTLELEAQVVLEQRASVTVVVGALRLPLAGRHERHGALRPDLAVGVRVARPHRLPLVLEDLDVRDVVARAELLVLRRPQVHDAAHGGELHVGERLVVARREAEHAAGARLVVRDEQPIDVHRRTPAAGGERGEVVLEDEGLGVLGVAVPADALVAGAEVAGRVVGRPPRDRGLLDLPLPRSLGAVRRDEHPLAAERVEAAVRPLGERVERGGDAGAGRRRGVRGVRHVAPCAADGSGSRRRRGGRPRGGRPATTA